MGGICTLFCSCCSVVAGELLQRYRAVVRILVCVVDFCMI